MAPEESVKLITDNINQADDHRSLNISNQLISLPGNGIPKIDRLRGVTRSLVADALDILERMHEDCQKSPELRENFYQLYHCLDFLKRFCDGRV